MTTDTTITIKMPVEICKRSYPKGWRARIGAHDVEGERKPDVLADLRTRVEQALVVRDAGKVSRVAVVGDTVYVLACDASGRWGCTSGKLNDDGLADKGMANLSTPERWHGNSADGVDAAAHFHKYIIDLRKRHAVCEQARPLHDETSRLLHILAATGQDTTHVSSETSERLAVITGFAVAGMRADLDAANARDRVDAQVSAGQGMSPEGLALARLLGLHGDDLPARVAAAASNILASTCASKWSGTFNDLAVVVGGTGPLDTLARAVDALDDPEQRVMSIGGPADDGPIAKHYETEITRERKGAYAEGIEAAEEAWKKHVAEIRAACEALDDAIAGLDIPDDDLIAFDVVLGGPRVAVTDALAAEPDEVEGLDD